MRLFRRRTKQPQFDWLVGESGQTYIDQGRFRLTIVAVDDQWQYQVSDSKGELAPTGSELFASREETINAAQRELEENPGTLHAAPDY